MPKTKFKTCAECPAPLACRQAHECLQALAAKQGGKFLGFSQGEEVDDDQVALSEFVITRLADLIVLLRTKFPLVDTEATFDEILYALAYLAAGKEEKLIGPVDRSKLDELTLLLVQQREEEAAQPDA